MFVDIVDIVKHHDTGAILPNISEKVNSNYLKTYDHMQTYPKIPKILKNVIKTKPNSFQVTRSKIIFSI